MVTMSMDMQTLQTTLGQVPVGEAVHLSVITNRLPTEAELGEIEQAFVSGGVRMLSAPRGVMLEWDGYSVAAVDLNFVQPQRIAEGTTGLLPMLLLIGILAGAAGYVVWKGGEIAETATERLFNLIVPMTMLVGGIYLLAQYGKRAS